MSSALAAPAVPVAQLEGLPAYLTLGQLARVTGLTERTVRSQMEAGRLSFLQLGGKGGWRMVTPQALENFASQYGMTLHWEEVL